jgi:hypothetical protein
MIHSIAFRSKWDWIQKRKQDITINPNQNENKSQIPYDYEVEDQKLLEIPRILQKLSIPLTEPYHVTNMYKILQSKSKSQKEIVSKRAISVDTFHSIKILIKYGLGGE